MTISFSGLASGLDTSSWVESLTALKRAKVETYTAEREKYVLNKETLSGIKSFFSSFRSMIEKVTDSRLGLGTGLDLFAQTKALTSNANILTAISTADAKEGTYEVNVKNLATNTEATSGYKHSTTTTVTETATLGSTLTSLGVKAGKIGVTVNGSERQIRLGNDETIQSFIQKLSNIGVNSDYDEVSGIFSLDLNTSAIRDIDNTGIIKALHLKNINSTYTTNTLKTQITNTTVQQATGDTKLSELGISSGKICLQHERASGSLTTITVSATTTIDSFVQSLNNAGYSASFSDGKISLDNAYISGDPIGLMDAFGWREETVASSGQVSNKLSYSTTITEASVIDRNTLLKDLNTGVAVNDGDTVVFEYNCGILSTVTLEATSTVGDLIDYISSYTGIYITLNDGIITIEGGVIRGGTYDIVKAFDLTTDGITSTNSSNHLYVVNKITTIQNDATSTATITYTETRTAQLTDYIDDYIDFDTFEESIDSGVKICGNDGYSDIFDLSDMTFQDLFDELHSYGIEATLTNGVISLNSTNGRYVVSGLECFGITSSDVTVSTTRTTDTLYHTYNSVATSSSKISDFVSSDPSDWSGDIVDGSGNVLTVETSGLDSDSTFGDLKNVLSSQGITMTMNDGVIKLTSSTGAYVNGDFFDELGITRIYQTITQTGTQESVSTTIQTTTLGTIGIATESTEAIKVTQVTAKTTYEGLSITSANLNYESVKTTTTASLTEFTTIGDAFGITGNLVYTLTVATTSNGSTNTVTSKGTIASTATVGDLVLQLQNNGLKTAGITNNNISLDFTAFTLEDPNDLLASTVMTSTTSIFSSSATGTQRGYITTQCGQVTTTTTTVVASSSTTLGELNTAFTSGTMILRKKSGGSKILTFTSDQTIDDVISTLGSYGITATLVRNLLSEKLFINKNTIISDFSSADVEEGLHDDLNDNTTVLSDTNEGISTVASGDYIQIAYNNSTLSISTADSDYVIYSAKSALQAALGLTDKLGSDLSYTSTTTRTTTISNATEDTTFIQLASNNDAFFETISIYNSSTGSIETIILGDGGTISDCVQLLQSKGVNASYDETTSKFKIAASDSYIVSMSEKIANMLNLNGLSFSSVQTETTTITTTTTSDGTITKTVSANTTSNKLEKAVRGYANLDTKIGDLETPSTGTIKLQTSSGEVSITVTEDMTVDGVLNSLYVNGVSFGNVGILNGVIEFNPSGKSPSSANGTYVLDFGGVFGLYGADYVTGNSNSSVLTTTTLCTATMDTTFGDIGISSLSFALVNSYTDERATIAVTSTTTFSDFANQLSDYDLNLSITDGIASLTRNGGGQWYMNTSGKNGMSQAFNLNCTTQTNTTYRTLSNSSTDLDTSIDSWYDYRGNSYDDHYDTSITVHVDDTTTTITLNSTDSLQDFIDKLAACGVDVTIKNGYLNFSGKGDVYIEGLESIGVSSQPYIWDPTGVYTSKSALQSSTSTSETRTANKETKLSDLGITTGEYYLYKDGVKHTLYVSEGDTVGDFIDTLKSYGLSAGISNGEISWFYSGDAYFMDKSGGSNILEKLNSWGDQGASISYNYSGTPTYEKEETTLENATLDTKLGEIYDETFMSSSGIGGTLKVSFNGNNYEIELLDDDTIQELMNEFIDIGINASFSNGKITLDAGNGVLTITDPQEGESGLTLARILNISESTAIHSATDPDTPVISQEVVVTSSNTAAANYADKNTKLSLLNISAGTLSVYRDGQKATINIGTDDTFGTLEAKISSAFSDVKLTFNDGYLTIGSNNAEVVVGTATDTSNFVAITGIVADSDKNSTSARSLYKVNNSSKVVESGLFVGGNVTQGTFKVGNATIEINKDTTLNDIISQINYSDDSSATAYWDNINGNFVIKSKVTGASLINIEAGTSNFTDVMGFTQNDGGVKKMNIENQTLGQNAHFTINGTNFTSNSNTVTSDVSKIDGVTLELKDITQEGAVTLTIEKDKDSIADAISNVVDSYNSLMENIDKEISSTGNLNGESTLKFIKNQIRSLMTGSISNSGSFKNLSQIGITLEAASAGNIKTDNINTLSFDKDTFLTAFAKDSSSLKSLLIGTDTQSGILTQVENILESALGSVTGYFASAEKSLNTKISNLDTKIEKTNTAVDRYKSRLESKFKTMDMLISKFQNQYSSFLS